MTPPRVDLGRCPKCQCPLTLHTSPERRWYCVECEPPRPAVAAEEREFRECATAYLKRRAIHPRTLEEWSQVGLARHFYDFATRRAGGRYSNESDLASVVDHANTLAREVGGIEEVHDWTLDHTKEIIDRLVFRLRDDLLRAARKEAERMRDSMNAAHSETMAEYEHTERAERERDNAQHALKVATIWHEVEPGRRVIVTQADYDQLLRRTEYRELQREAEILKGGEGI